MGQLNGTLSAGNNNLATAHGDGDGVRLQVSGAVTIAFGEAATANSWDVPATTTVDFNGRNFARKNVNLYSAAGGETYKIIW